VGGGGEGGRGCRKEAGIEERVVGWVSRGGGGGEGKMGVGVRGGGWGERGDRCGGNAAEDGLG